MPAEGGISLLFSLIIVFPIFSGFKVRQKVVEALISTLAIPHKDVKAAVVASSSILVKVLTIRAPLEVVAEALICLVFRFRIFVPV